MFLFRLIINSANINGLLYLQYFFNFCLKLNKQGVLNRKKIILFDGVCNLCNSLINNIIRLDSSERFLFAPLQGEKGKEVIEEFNLQKQNIDSIVLYSDQKVKIKSQAVIDIIYTISPLFRFIIIFKITN